MFSLSISAGMVQSYPIFSPLHSSTDRLQFQSLLFPSFPFKQKPPAAFTLSKAILHHYITSFSTLQLKARENHVKISKCWISKLRQTHSEEVQNQNLSLPIRFWSTKSSQWQYHSSAMHKVWIIQQKGGFWEAKSPLNPSQVVVFQTGMQLIPLPGYPLAAEVDCLQLLLAWFHPKDITISTLQSCSTM